MAERTRQKLPSSLKISMFGSLRVLITTLPLIWIGHFEIAPQVVANLVGVDAALLLFRWRNGEQHPRVRYLKHSSMWLQMIIHSAGEHLGFHRRTRRLRQSFFLVVSRAIRIKTELPRNSAENLAAITYPEACTLDRRRDKLACSDG